MAKQALPQYRVAHRLTHQPQNMQPIVEADALFADQPAGARYVMIAQVLADARQLMAHLDAETAQALRLADAR